MLLVDVVEGELNDNLAESGIFFRLLNSLGSPNHVDDLRWVALLVTFFS